MSKDRGISSGEQKHAASARVWVNKREAIPSLEIDRHEENRYTLVAIGKVTAKTSENIGPVRASILNTFPPNSTFWTLFSPHPPQSVLDGLGLPAVSDSKQLPAFGSTK
jgi:hypothetical protein